MMSPQSEIYPQLFFESNESTKLLPIVDAYLSVNLNLKCKQALEVGVYKGGWIFTMKSNLPEIQIDAIDPYPNLTEIRNAFLQDVEKINSSRDIKLFKDWSEHAKNSTPNTKYQIIHLDGEHSQLAVSNDLTRILPVMSPECILIIDDIFYHSFPGVTAAAFQFLSDTNLKCFLFTEKKLYICSENYYQFYYQRAIDLLSYANLKFEEDYYLTQKMHAYAQSNSLFGSSLVIIDKLSDWQSLRFMKNLKIRIPPLLMIKATLRLCLPSGALSLLKFARSHRANI